MALMQSIMNPQMRFLQPYLPPALTVNPELAKAAAYGGGSQQQQPAAGGATPGSGVQTAPVAGQTPVGADPTQNGGAPSGILGSIAKLMNSGGSGQGINAIMQLLGMGAGIP